jgi:hypothetical protein
VSLQSVGDGPLTTSGLSHSSQEGKFDNFSELSSFFSVQDVETTLLNKLSGNFKSFLITLFVFCGHCNIIKEDSHVFVTSWLIGSDFLLNFGFNILLIVERSSGEREVDSLE